MNDFDVIDTNVDGLISYREFQRWHKAVLRADPRASASKKGIFNNSFLGPSLLGLFGSHDLDLDGQLAVPEFVPLVFELSQKPEKEAEKVFRVGRI